jgi:hypothetical protein
VNSLKVKINVKAGGLSLNHNQTITGCMKIQAGFITAVLSVRI